MALTSFCGLLTLQVGTAILAALFFCLAGAVLAANIFDYHSDIKDGWFPYSLVLMLIFVFGLIAAGALIFASSYAKSRPLAIAALILTLVLTCYWLALSCLSFLSIRSQVEGICIDRSRRCPESFWLANLRYRRYQIPPEQLAADEARRTCRPRSLTRAPRSVEAIARKEDGLIGKTSDTSLDVFEDKDDIFRRRRMEPATRNDLMENRVFQEMEKGIHYRQTKNINDTTLDVNEEIKIKLQTSERYRGQGEIQRKPDTGQSGSFDSSNRHRADVLGNLTSWKTRDRRELQQWEWYPRTTTTPKYKWGPPYHSTPTRAHSKYKKPINETELYANHSRYYFGIPMIAAICLFIVNLLFLLFAALVMYSWAQQIDYDDDSYYEEDPVVIVEEFIE